MHFAACFGLWQLLNAILAAGAGVNIKGKEGDTPLHYAALMGHLDIVNILLYKGANVKVVDILGNATLHYAAIKGHVGIVYVLLAMPGINVNAKDKYGNTPIGFAQLARGDDERQQWQDIVTIMQQRLEFTRKRDFAGGGATLGTALGGAGVAADLISEAVEPKYIILTVVAIALVSLAVGYIVYPAFKEPSAKIDETQTLLV